MSRRLAISKIALTGALVIATSGCAYFAQSSIASDGTLGNGDARLNPIGARGVLSDDGRYVVFESQSDNLVPNDTNTKPDVFRHDNVSGTTVRVSLDDQGAQTDLPSSSASISANGRYVAFSTASPLIAADTNELADVYRKDMTTGALAIVNLDENGDLNTDPNLQTGEAAMSADGQRFAWTPHFNSFAHPFLRDMSDAASVALSGGIAPLSLDISRDGEHVIENAFCGLKCPNPPIKVWDLASPYAFAPPDGHFSDISPDGRYVTLMISQVDEVFDRQTGALKASGATGLLSRASEDHRFRISIESPSQAAVMIDLLTGVTRRVDGPLPFADPPPDFEYPFSMTPDGRYVVFQKDAAAVFTTDGAFPKPIGVSPGFLARGSDHVSMTIAGGFFLPNAIVDGGPGITIHSTQFDANGSLTVVLSIAADAAVGDHTIKVQNPGAVGDSWGYCSDCLAVT